MEKAKLEKRGMRKGSKCKRMKTGPSGKRRCASFKE